VIHVYDAAGNVIETHEQAGQFKELSVFVSHQVHARDQAGAVSAHFAAINNPCRGSERLALGQLKNCLAEVLNN